MSNILVQYHKLIRLQPSAAENSRVNTTANSSHKDAVTHIEVVQSLAMTSTYNYS